MLSDIQGGGALHRAVGPIKWLFGDIFLAIIQWAFIWSSVWGRWVAFISSGGGLLNWGGRFIQSRNSLCILRVEISSQNFGELKLENIFFWRNSTPPKKHHTEHYGTFDPVCT